MCLDETGKYQLLGLRNNVRLQRSPLHSELDALIWAMENMSQHTSCQSFGTDYKDVISMVKDPSTWPTFSMELAEFEAIKGRYHNFKIFHIPRAQNKMVDALARTSRAS